MQVFTSAIPSPALLESGKEHQDTAQGSCLFCDATAGPAGKGVRKKSSIIKLHTDSKSPESNLAGPSVSPTLVHGGFLLLLPIVPIVPFFVPLCALFCLFVAFFGFFVPFAAAGVEFCSSPSRPQISLMDSLNFSSIFQICGENSPSTIPTLPSLSKIPHCH